MPVLAYRRWYDEAYFEHVIETIVGEMGDVI